jgi:uracil-DNA glycosylase family 4
MVDVPGYGPLDAKLAIVGARPGKEEAKGGRPFIGASGSLLRRLLYQAGVDPSECYITNAVTTHDPNRDLPTLGEIHEARPRLAAELRRVSPNCVLVLGGEANYALNGRKGIDAWRGSILESSLIPGLKTVCAWHPANIQRTFERSYILDLDLRRAIKQSEFPEIRRPERIFHLDPDIETCINFLDAIPPGARVTVDIECPMRAEGLYCVGVGWNAKEILCIPFVGGSYLPLSHLATVVRRLNSVLETNPICGQNIGFDVHRLEAFGFRIKEIGFDTMLAHHLLWPEAGTKQKGYEGKENFSGGHDLGFISSIYTEEPYYKFELHEAFQTSPPNWRMMWEYNCKDVAVTHESMDALQVELDEFNQDAYFREHVLSLIRPVWRMQSRGLEIDSEALRTKRARYELETKVLQARFERLIGFECNVKSAPDIRHLLYTHFQLPVKKKTAKGGGASTDEETLRILAYTSPYAPVLKGVLDIRERRTMLSGFMQLESATDGRYRAAYLIHGTDSGRLSSRSPKDLDGRKGPQLQNIPKSFRSIFRATKDHVIMQADLRRAEAMFVAYDAQEEALIEIFQDPSRDLYRELAEYALSRKIEKGSVERECFKSVCHASNYKMGAKRFITVLRLKGIDIEDIYVRGITKPLAKGEYLMGTYHQRFKNIRPWQNELGDQVRRTRTLHDVFGRRRFFMGRMDDSLSRIACSYRPQATIVGVTNQAFRRLDAQGAPIILQVHDSLALEINVSAIVETATQVEAAFNHPITLHGRTFVIPIDLQIGLNWGELREYNEKEDRTSYGVNIAN